MDHPGRGFIWLALWITAGCGCGGGDLVGLKDQAVDNYVLFDVRLSDGQQADAPADAGVGDAFLDASHDLSADQAADLAGTDLLEAGSSDQATDAIAVEQCAKPAWWRSAVGVFGPVHAIWGSGPGDVYLGLDGALLHHDGQALELIELRTKASIRAIWGAAGGAGVIYAAGDGGVLRRFDGKVWQGISAGTLANLRAIWGSGPQDVYLAGTGGTLLHFDGASWKPVVSGTTETLGGIWGSSASDVFVVGAAGTVLHFDGSTWSKQATLPAPLAAVWGTGSSNVYAVGGKVVHRFDGTSWAVAYSTINPDVSLSGIWGSSAGEVHAVGPVSCAAAPCTYSSLALRFDGATWTETAVAADAQLSTIWGSGTTHVLAGGDSVNAPGAGATTVWRFNGAYWGPEFHAAAPVRDLWGRGPSEVHAVGDRSGLGVVFQRGGAGGWSELYVSTTGTLGAIWSGGSDLIAFGPSSLALHHDGTSWLKMSLGSLSADFQDAWGDGIANVLAVTGNTGFPASGRVLRYYGTVWAQLKQVNDPLYGVWGGLGAGGKEIFAVGAKGAALRHDGTSWASLTTGTTQDLRAVWGSAPGEVFAVGAGGTILRFDGTTWSVMSSPATGTLGGVWGSGPQDVYAAETTAAGQGRIYHYDGVGWKTALSTPDGLGALWGRSAGDVFAAGVRFVYHLGCGP